MENRPIKREQEIADILFSNNCFHLDNWLESNDTPSYNPSLNAMYIPKIENKTLRGIATSHEYSHLNNSNNPKTCLLRIISRFIYYELNHQNYDDSCDLSVLSLDQNPRLRMFKGFYDIIVESINVVQEVKALRSFTALKSDFPIAKIWEKVSLDKYESQLPEFRRIYEMVTSLSEGCTIPLWYLETFPLDAPTYLPSILFNEGETVNSIDVTDEIAEEAIKEFQKNSLKLPFSPLKRLEAILKAPKKFPGKGVKNSRLKFHKKIMKYSDFNENDFPELGREKTFPQKCNHCPVDFLHSRGILIPYEDFGPVLPHYCNDPKYKMLNCDIEKAFGKYKDHILNEDERLLSGLNQVQLLINENGASYGHFSRKVNPEYQQVRVERYFAYESNWPLTSFLVASEILKYFVFHNSEFTDPPSNLTLIDRICFTRGVDFWKIPKQKVTYSKLSPFITVKTVKVGLKEVGLDYELS